MSREKSVVTIVQARTSSTRLPGKVLLSLCGDTLLARMIERVSLAKQIGKIVVATTTSDEDAQIVEWCVRNQIEVYQGSKSDLLDRHYQVAIKYRADVVVKIPSDCPLIDPNVIDKVIKYYLTNENKFDYVSNLHPATFPDGNDVEVMSFAALEQAWENATATMELEHTTPYLWENPNNFKIGNLVWETGLDYSMTHRWTIDYPEDYEFIKQVYERLYPINPKFSLTDILQLLKTEPMLKKINEKWVGVNWYRNHLHELKTVGKEQTRVLVGA
ncbi:MAG: glycosyltransferase family protein [Cytophagales bacterium]|nr:glycosyltransferase family protein [Cytophagales bacterium]MCA6386261.1 glycosyltransferase family protein [Cytophagales bacterium]MCA6391458.1 glycosyltransferase family protein [Cytophagales bacterium]MCA6399126.1 glycosyltransferase family protein [Cytophagales bacterium]MCA6401488.1 glycosyltransferase family protein [Cytophagales bacterium]